MTISIEAARTLWIHADPVFGGSESQVQFPAELSGFFSLPANPHIGVYVQRAVIYAGMPLPAKKMDFHHNNVWRLNLPTANQGLGGYTGKVLVFEKTDQADTYRLWLIEPGSPVAKRLRGLARRNGKLGSKQREDGSKREYGYF